MAPRIQQIRQLLKITDVYAAQVLNIPMQDYIQKETGDLHFTKDEIIILYNDFIEKMDNQPATIQNQIKALFE